LNSAVEIYRCDGTFRRVEVRPLLDVLRIGLSHLLRRNLSRASFAVLLHEVPDTPRPPGRPAFENLLPELGYATVVVVEDGHITYRHPHPVDELIGRPLRSEIQAKYPPESSWGYRVIGPNVPKLLTRPTPRVEGSILVDPYDRDESPAFRVRRVPDPDPPLSTLHDFGVDSAPDDLVKVVVHDDVARQLQRDRRFSTEVEEGGFLVGKVFRDEAHEGTFLVEITGALEAHFTGASLLHFTFTGDSFQEVKRNLRERQGEQLVGWYHTHLFPARERMGLSTIDLDLHFSTFRKPWQLAGLVNLDKNDQRTLRFYVRQDETMDLCPQWAVGEAADERRG
jgi:proteasome lid subunit RPN8/RPN11